MTARIDLTRAQRALAEWMLVDGASHREIARTLGVPRDRIDKTYPGTGWTYREAGKFTAAVRRFESTPS